MLYCGIGTDVEVRQGHGDDVVLEGTKATIGLSADGARQDLSKIEILADQVEDFFESGPHEGEVFSGTSGDEKSTLTSFSTPTRHDWEERTHPSVYDRGRVEELFPSLKEQVHSLPEEIRKALRHATRISILRQRMADVVMPRQVYTPKLQKVFRANYIGSERVHGPIGSASLVVFVPPAKTVTVVGGREVHVSGLRGSVNLIGADKVELSDIEGTVYLFDCPLTSARRITGRLWQRFYRYGDCYFSDHPTTRVRRGDWESQIEEVNGEVDLEVGRVMLDLADLAGPVRIHNHYGTTRLSQNHFKGGTRFQLRTKSGEILLFLKRDLIEQVNMTVNTLCGVVNCEMLKPMLSRSTGLLITLSTMNSPQDSDLVDADFYIQTESGGVTVEGMK